MTEPASLDKALSAYIGARMPDARTVVVSDIDRIYGGFSRETYRFRLRVEDEDGEREQRLILRRDPPRGGIVDTERRVEFAVLKAFFDTPVPVPKMFWLEEDPSALGAPFFVCEEVVDCEDSPYLLQTPHYLPLHSAIATAKWSALGHIAREDPIQLGLASIFPIGAGEDRWRSELDRWEAVIDEAEDEPQLITRAAIRWLRRRPPPPAQKLSVVHGDFRTGNFLYDGAGAVRAVLDWEMAHLGDPLEDLAWSLGRGWCFGGGDRRGGLATRGEAVRIWEAASGLIADPDALRWWELFNSVKAQAIWMRGVELWTDGRGRAANHVVCGWFMQDLQDRATLELMERL